MNVLPKSTVCRGEHCSSAPAGGAIRFKALKIYLTDARPVIMAASFHRRTANGRPYDLYFFAALSFRKWQYTEFLRRT